MPIDSTLLLFLEGYGWLPARRRHSPAGVARTRLLGRLVTGVSGPDAARFFYDEANVRRHAAVPEPILSTLFGHDAVHTLDGTAHRHRKALFTALLDDADVAALVHRTTEEWDEAARSWVGREWIVLFDEAARVLTRAVCRWAGVPLDDAEVAPVAADLVTTIDGFATPGPRHWRARAARRRLESRFAHRVAEVRRGAAAPAGSALEAVARHREPDGAPLAAHLAAVELLNVIRPTVAVGWFVAFTAHALHRWPRQRARLRTGDEAFTQAFAHEIRRFYPFVPFLGGRAVRDLSWRGVPIPAGSLVLLDVYGQNHDPLLWAEPYTFDPERFIDRPIDAFAFIPQGGGDPRTGHRCPGEDLTIALLRALAPRLARLEYEVPRRYLRISLRRIPARPASGVVLTSVRLPAPAAAAGAPRAERRTP